MIVRRMARLGMAGQAEAGLWDGRLAGTEVRAPGVHARARRGMAQPGEVRRGAARNGRVAHIRVRVSDARAWRGLARQGEVWLCTAGCREAGMDGRLADIGVRVLDAHAWQGEARYGRPRPVRARHGMGDWQSSGFEAQTPTTRQGVGLAGLPTTTGQASPTTVRGNTQWTSSSRSPE